MPISPLKCSEIWLWGDSGYVGCSRSPLRSTQRSKTIWKSGIHKQFVEGIQVWQDLTLSSPICIGVCTKYISGSFYHVKTLKTLSNTPKIFSLTACLLNRTSSTQCWCLSRALIVSWFEELLESISLQIEITLHVFALWMQHVSSGTSVKYEVLQIELYAGCFARAAALAVCKECAWVKGNRCVSVFYVCVCVCILRTAGLRFSDWRHFCDVAMVSCWLFIAKRKNKCSWGSS